MLACEDLNDTAACRISPEDEVAKSELLHDAFEVTNVILDEITPLRIPAGVAMSAHVDGDHAMGR